MSEDCIESVAGQLSPPITPIVSPPVTRDPRQVSREARDGARASIVTIGPITIAFAAGDAE